MQANTGFRAAGLKAPTLEKKFLAVEELVNVTTSISPPAIIFFILSDFFLPGIFDS